MACGGRWRVWCCVLFVILRVVKTEIIQRNSFVPKWEQNTRGQQRKQREGAPASEFSHHTVIRPRLYHGREKRQLDTSKHSEGGHVFDLTVGYDVDGKDYVLDLQLNRELIPRAYFERYQHNGKRVVNRPTAKEVELCQYQGKLRGISNSWAAISTCNGLRGVVFDGVEMHYLERGFDSEVEDGGGGYDGGGGGSEDLQSHILYKHSDLITNHSCGYSDTPYHFLENQEFNRILRYKREADEVRGPYNANKRSRYVELVLVVDNKEYKELGESMSRVYNHCKDIANIINALYVPLNIFVALVGVVVWTEGDEITLQSNGDATLTSFLEYRRKVLVKEHPNDNAQLLTRVQFDGGVVGKALKGPICTYEFSGGVSMDHSSVVGLVATTVAHEMGHNFGMEHDTTECKCPSEKCIMAASSSSLSPTHWSSCSLEYLALAFEHGMDYCLRNKPQSLFDGPVCGNGFVEAGEQCDCGLPDHCDNTCCNATTCMLYANASCATGECCDLQTCHPMKAGSICRSSDHECDLPEYCTGQSEYCPDDVFKMDGEKCDKGRAFCYQGSCRTHSDQCRLLWGPSGKSSDMLCYHMNNRGTLHGNCGYNRLNKSFLKCTEEDIYCGMLHCRHLNEKLEFGMESVATLSHTFINAGGKIIPCRTAIVDLGLNEIDPGLAPNGAKCGEGKMCVNQRCMAVGSLRAGTGCPQDCNDNGVCNSRGHCHCKTGFAPPLCDYPGTGGSEDSGPASDPNARKDIVTTLYVIFLGVVPLCALIALFMYYTRRNVKYWWKKSNTASPNVTANGRCHPLRPEKKVPQTHKIIHGNALSFRSDRPNGIEISSPVTVDSRNNSDSAHVSLLSKQDGNGSIATNNIPAGSLQNNLLGQFKGFTITPLSSSPLTNSQSPSPPSRTVGSPVSPPVLPNVGVMPSKPVNMGPKTSSNARNSFLNSHVNVSDNHVGQNTSTTSNTRPLISSPILDATTCTAKELIASRTAPSVPTRPAPQVPPTNSKPDVAPAQKPPRPVSSPNAFSVNTISLDDKKVKENGSSYPTLTRIASFMMRQNPVHRSQSQNQSTSPIINKKSKSKPLEGIHSLPRTVHHGAKGQKFQIDRETLRNLQISNPIPQQEIEVPQNALNVKQASEMSEDEESTKNVVMRAQSMRATGTNSQRPAIPTFGSMRQSSASKRPTSIPSGIRPTSPPPRPPPPPSNKTHESVKAGIIGMPGYQNPSGVGSSTDYGYDDCLNLIQDGTAPLANIDEESSPTHIDNIYAVIEESPPECSRKQIGRDETYSAPIPPKAISNESTSSGSKFEYSAPCSNEYQSPKPIENSISTGSAESVGLLSEIVNEIQARNVESIYGTSTMGRKKNKGDKVTQDADEDDTTGAGQTDGTLSPQLLPDKESVISSSNSSLGTYVNAPYTSNTYRPLGSTYSNMSSQNCAKPTNSSSSSSSGYINPLVVNGGPPNFSQALNNSKDFSTFKSGFKSINDSTSKANSENDKTPKEVDISTYKPYSSSLNRSLGPFAASFRSSQAADKLANNPSQTPGVPVEKNTPADTLPKVSNQSSDRKDNDTSPSVPVPNKPLSRTPTPPSLPQKTAVTNGKNVSSSLTKSNFKGKTNNTMKTSINNSPDVVSSCSIGENSSAKSPDVLGGKVQEKISGTSPDVVPSNSEKLQSPTSSNTKTSVGGRTSATVNSAKLSNSASSKLSSFRNMSSGKQPPSAPKPVVPKLINQTEKKNINSSKDNSVKNVGKGSSISKSVSEPTGNRTMPVGARQAANKLSHVASLQQKFETVSDKNITPVSNMSRLPSSAGSKTKTPNTSSKTVVETGKSAISRK